MCEKRLLRIEEVMQIIPYSKSKIYELIRNGRLKAACPNGPGKKPIFVIKESIEKYIEEITVDPDDWKDPELARAQIQRRIISKGRNGHRQESS